MSTNLKLKKNAAVKSIRDFMDMKSNESLDFDFVPSGVKLLGFQITKPGVKYRFDNSESINEGGVNRRLDGAAMTVDIGMKEIASSKQPYIEDEDFAKVIWVICHESVHVRQCNDTFRKTDADFANKQQAIESLAIYNNPIYYTDCHNYEKNSNELEAEYHGFLQMVDYFHDNFPYVSNREKNKMIVNLVNQHCQRDYFLGPKGRTFNSIDEIDEAFQDAYILSFTTMKKYPMPGTREFTRLFGDAYSGNCVNKDVLAICAGGDEKLRIVFENANSRFEQDLIVAAVNRRICSDYDSNSRCLDDVDLSYQHVIADKYDEIMAERSKAETWYDKAYKEVNERNFDTDVETKSEPEVKDVEMHNNRRLPHIDWGDDKDKQDEFQ